MTPRAASIGLILIALISSVLSLMLTPVGFIISIYGRPAQLSTGLVAAGVIIAALGVLFFSAAIGTIRRRAWGWKIAFWLFVSLVPLMLFCALPVLPGQSFSVGNAVVQGMLATFSALGAWFLSRNEVRALCGLGAFNICSAGVAQ